MPTTAHRRRSITTLLGALLAVCVHAPVSLKAQTIRGTLLGQDTDEPVHLGFVAMLTESGDSVTSTVTDRSGRFSVTSPEPGSFLLLAAALGHRETTVGVFELGEDGELTVEFRLPIEALTLEGLIVQADRIAQEPSLALNGFLRRMQQGLGHFLTPTDIQASAALTTSELFFGMLGMTVIGDQVRIRNAGNACAPRIWIDGLPQVVGSDFSLDFLVPLEELAAVEVYRRGLEVPLQYGGSSAGCGVILFWTKTGQPG